MISLHPIIDKTKNNDPFIKMNGDKQLYEDGME